MKSLTAIAIPLVFIALLLAIWEAACRLTGVPAYLLPPPSAISASLAEGWPLLLSSAWNTLFTALTALLVASLLASSLALLTALSPVIERAIQPVAVTLQVTPVIAVAPLVIIWAGLDHPERAVVVLATIVAFFPIFSSTAIGLASPPAELLDLFRLNGAGRWATLRLLRLPAALPYFLSGLRISGGLALVGAVVAEFVAGAGGFASGLAYRILESGYRLQIPRMFAALVLLSLTRR